MSAFPILLGEVADKEPSIWFFYVAIIICAVIALPVLKSKRVAVIALPLALISTFFSVAFIASEVRDPFVGPAIVQELGQGYVASGYGAAIIPLLILAALLFRPGTMPKHPAEPKTPGSVTSRAD